jgi:hypothetical protein
MKICTGVQAMLRLCFRNLRGCNNGTSNKTDLRNMPLRWLYVAWYPYQVSRRSVQAFRQYYGFDSGIWEAVMLVLLMGGMYELRHWYGVWPSVIKIGSDIEDVTGGGGDMQINREAYLTSLIYFSK